MKCKHKNTKENHYMDYDRNMYEVICLDCGKILFDGNYYEYEKYKTPVIRVNKTQ